MVNVYCQHASEGHLLYITRIHCQLTKLDPTGDHGWLYVFRKSWQAWTHLPAPQPPGAGEMGGIGSTISGFTGEKGLFSLAFCVLCKITVLQWCWEKLNNSRVIIPQLPLIVKRTIRERFCLERCSAHKPCGNFLLTLVLQRITVRDSKS